MKSKGFTLAELLAVIAIMSILITLAVPSIIKLYNNAKKNAFASEAQSIIKAAEEGYALSMLSKEVEDTVYTYTDGSESHTGNIDMYISGNKPQNGEVKINAEGQVSIALHNGEYCATKNYISKEVTVEAKALGECINITTTSETCFEFDNGTITLYYHNNPECSSNVIIPSIIDGVNVTVIGSRAFEEKALTTVTIPNSVEYIGYGAFEDNFLTSISIPESITSIGYHAFYNNSLEYVELLEGLISIGDYAFSNNAISSIIIPGSVTNIGDFAFSSNALSNVTIPESITNIKRGIFYNNSLIGVTILGNVTNIGEWAFASNLLTNVTIPSNVTSIGDYAFYLNNLTTITIPGSVTNIGTEAFNYNSFSEINIEGDNPKRFNSYWTDIGFPSEFMPI